MRYAGEVTFQLFAVEFVVLELELKWVDGVARGLILFDVEPHEVRVTQAVFCSGPLSRHELEHFLQEVDGGLNLAIALVLGLEIDIKIDPVFHRVTRCD